MRKRSGTKRRKTREKRGDPALLRRLRKLAEYGSGWEDVAAALCVSRQALLYWRTGERTPRRRALRRLELVERCVFEADAPLWVLAPLDSPRLERWIAGDDPEWLWLPSR